MRRLIPLFLLALLMTTPFWMWVSRKLYPLHQSEESPYVNVYNWYGMIDRETIKEFEKETGITVRYDLYDSNDQLDARLMAGFSGYDVVFPSASPYAAQLIGVGAFLPLNKELLPNLEYMDEEYFNLLQAIDPGNRFIIPYYVGTIGITYVKEKILEKMPDAPLDSYDLIFNPNVVHKLVSCGITFLEEDVDVYPLMLKYLGYDINDDSWEHLETAQKYLEKVRPYIKKFSNTNIVTEIITGESYLAQAWSDQAAILMERVRDIGRKNFTIVYVTPKIGTSVWADVAAIPKDSQHPKNAHKFINFLMRPDISARVMQAALALVPNKQVEKYLPKGFRDDNPALFVTKEILQNSRINSPQTLKYRRKRSRLWALFRQGQFDKKGVS